MQRTTKDETEEVVGTEVDQISGPVYQPTTETTTESSDDSEAQRREAQKLEEYQDMYDTVEMLTQPSHVVRYIGNLMRMGMDPKEELTKMRAYYSPVGIAWYDSIRSQNPPKIES